MKDSELMNWRVEGDFRSGDFRSGAFRRDDRTRGAILIVALGILTLLAVLGATFAQLMSLEKKGVENFVESQHVDLLTNSAIDTAIAELNGWSNRRSWTVYPNLPWLYLIRDQQAMAHGRAPIEDDRVGNWRTYSEMAGKRFRFKTKIIDCASQINLNGRQDTLARMLDNLGQAIERSPRLKLDGKLVTNPFFTQPNRGGYRVRGRDILLFRQRLEGQRFQSKSQLRQLIGRQNYALVKDFLTCWSWEDPYTWRASDGLNEVPDLSAGLTSTGGAGGGGGLGGGTVNSQPLASDNPRLDPEPRHPININTAPEEVLISTLQGLAGRRLFPYSQIGVNGGAVQAIDQNAQILGERILFGKEEIRNVVPRAVFAYMPRLEYSHAQKIAQRIMQDRKIQAKAFRTWRTNDISRPGFEDFIDGLQEDFFPAPTNVDIIDPQQPQNRQIQARIISGGGGTSPMARLWNKGNANGSSRSILRTKGFPVHDRFAWYYEAIKSVIKANFNPNTRINRYNPNRPAFIPVDKSDLVWAETRQNLKKGHTTEYCFDSMGIYEITTLGEMLDVAAVQNSRTVVNSVNGSVSPEVFPFRRKMRTVVKIFDVLRHTNQFHFARTFQSGSRSSRNDRRYVVTWPEPMAALTELYSQGSRRDGRVELAGQLDGISLSRPARNRIQSVGSNPAVIMAQGFQNRTNQSLNRLRMVLNRGGGTSFFGDEVSNTLRDVFDADFSRSQRRFREYYRKRKMSQLGVFAGNSATWNDPLVQREELGTDLFPDGLNSTIRRTPHTGSRMVVLPARAAIGQPGGGGNIKVGDSGLGSRGNNTLGNVPYYRGGMAFWCKFDFNGDDPVFSGLIGCTTVIRGVQPTPNDYSGSEGSQFFIFKNTEGQLRIVRMYYHQAYPENLRHRR
ncbi:MAG: hypothetical protein AAF517_21215, partial [Planctomycetota bacterium]